MKNILKFSLVLIIIFQFAITANSVFACVCTLSSVAAGYAKCANDCSQVIDCTTVPNCAITVPAAATPAAGGSCLPTAGGSCTTPATPSNTTVPAVNLSNPLGSTVTVPGLVHNIINAALGVVGSLALVMFIYGGFTWMLAAGNEQAVEKGRNILVWAAIGLVVIFASYSLVNFVIGAITSSG